MGAKEPAALAHRKDMVEVGGGGMSVDTDEVIEIDGVRRPDHRVCKVVASNGGRPGVDVANQITHKPD